MIWCFSQNQNSFILQKNMAKNMCIFMDKKAKQKVLLRIVNIFKKEKL